MSTFYIPTGYTPRLSLYETQTAIGQIKQMFPEKLALALNLRRVSAPLFVEPHTGLNDDLNGTETPVSFAITETGSPVQIVHSLAKWKRMALHRYGFPMGQGLYTDMNAIRADEELGNLHSVYVDQWDWEKIIDPTQRTMVTLHAAAQDIVTATCDTAEALAALYPALELNLCRRAHILTTQELADQFPGLTPKERENAALKQYRTVVLTQIGGPLRDGTPHDGRAPDYDDWQLNADILFYCDVLDCALEISSMGIRVSPASLDAQLTAAGCDHRRTLPFHASLLAGELPLTMGGGIGQSRLCMLLLQKAHIGEVQVSVWDAATHKACEHAGVPLL